jgi:hypothetical protein
LDEIKDVARRLGPHEPGVEFFINHGDHPQLSDTEGRTPMFSFTRADETYDKGRMKWDEKTWTSVDVMRLGSKDIRMPHYYVRPEEFCSRPASPHCPALFRGGGFRV